MKVLSFFVHSCPFWYRCYYLHRLRDLMSPVLEYLFFKEPVPILIPASLLTLEKFGIPAKAKVIWKRICSFYIMLNISSIFLPPVLCRFQSLRPICSYQSANRLVTKQTLDLVVMLVHLFCLKMVDCRVKSYRCETRAIFIFILRQIITATWCILY